MFPFAELRRPSAFLPVVMSFAALSIVILYVLLVGPEPQKDEGAAAHLWQILMAGQLPIILYYMVRRLPEAPRAALLVLVLQISAIVAAAAPVFLLRF